VESYVNKFVVCSPWWGRGRGREERASVTMSNRKWNSSTETRKRLSYTFCINIIKNVNIYYTNAGN
jgi:hypothetical protein